MVYPDEPKDWQLIDREHDQKAKEPVVSILESLCEMNYTEYGATKDIQDRFSYYRFNSESQALFYEWLTELECEKLSKDDEPIVLENLSKYRSLMPSLALVFNLIAVTDGKVGRSISVESTVCAIGWCYYLESHTRRIYGMASNLVHQASIKLSKKIQEGGWACVFRYPKFIVSIGDYWMIWILFKKLVKV